MRTFVRIKQLLFCTLLLVASNFLAHDANAQSFEGRVIQSISSPVTGEEKMEMVMNFKGDKMMMAMDLGPQGGMKMYTENWGSKLTVVMEAMKMGFETDLSASAAKTASGSNPDLKATGKKETINGFAAEEWIATLSAEGQPGPATMTMWLTSDIDKSLIKGMGAMMKAQQAQNPNAQESEINRILSEKGLMPVRTVISANGTEQATIDLVKVEKASLPDALFVPASDITIQKAGPGMFQQKD